MKILKFPGARVIGKPEGWDDQLDGSCGEIYVADHLDLLSGVNQMFTFYRPSPEELKALADGGCLRLGILGNRHPVFNMTVIGPGPTELSKFEEAWDLGGVAE